MGKLSDYSTLRIYIRRNQGTLNCNASTGAYNISDIVASAKERCGFRAASWERGVASRGTASVVTTEKELSSN